MPQTSTILTQYYDNLIASLVPSTAQPLERCCRQIYSECHCAGVSIKYSPFHHHILFGVTSYGMPKLLYILSLKVHLLCSVLLQHTLSSVAAPKLQALVPISDADLYEMMTSPSRRSVKASMQIPLVTTRATICASREMCLL